MDYFTAQRLSESAMNFFSVHMRTYSKCKDDEQLLKRTYSKCKDD